MAGAWLTFKAFLLRWVRGVDYFIASMFIFAFLPLLPLVWEQASIAKIKLDSLTLAAAMYPIGVGTTSHSRSVFLAGIAVGIGMAYFYGQILPNPTAPIPLPGLHINSEQIAQWSIIGAVVVLAAEKFWWHIILKKTDLFEFL